MVVVSDACESHFRYKFGKIILKYPYIPLIVVVGLCIPFAMHAVTFQRGVSNINIAPRLASSTEAYLTIQRVFAAGRCVADVMDQPHHRPDVYALLVVSPWALNQTTFDFVHQNLVLPIVSP